MSIKVERPILFNDLSFHRIEISYEHLIFDNTSALNLLYESEVYYCFFPLFDLLNFSLLNYLITEFFLLYQTKNLFKSLKQ